MCTDLNNEKPDKGNLRETFLLNQLMVKHSISYPEKGDFLINGKYIIEVGGPSKTNKIPAPPDMPSVNLRQGICNSQKLIDAILLQTQI